MCVLDYRAPALSAVVSTCFQDVHLSLFWPKQSYTQRSQMFHSWEICNASVNYMPGCFIGWGRSGLWTIMSDALSVRLFCHKNRTGLTLSPCFCACLSLSLPVSVPVSLSLPVSRCIMAYCPVVTSSLRAKV